MAVSVVPYEDPDQSTFTTAQVQNPLQTLWWTTQTVSGVPENTMGWLVAQGWRITGVSNDTTTNPPTRTYALTTAELDTYQALFGLCNSWKSQSDEAQAANELRYNEVVADWTEMIASSQTQFNAQTTQHNADIGVYVDDLNAFMSDIEGDIDDNILKLEQDLLPVATALDEINGKLAELETNADANAVIVGELLTAQAGYLSDFITDLAAKLAELDTNYTAHLALIQALLADSDTDLATFIADQASQLSQWSAGYDLHVANTTGLLDGLGTTEEARIYEEFAASLSVQLQRLVNDGLYTSAVAVDITARNTRDRDEQIQLLKDRLNREKLDEKHKSYGQQIDFRTRSLDEISRRQQISQAVIQWKAAQLDRLLEQLQQIEMQQATGIEKEHAAQQDVSRVAMSERDVLLAQLQDAVKAILAGKDRYSAMLMQKATTIAEAKNQAIVQKMNTAVARLEAWKGVAAENQRLMAYQLDERNKLLIGLYSFVERRNDIGPEWKDMVQMIAGLGDAAGGWIQP